jgi:carboxylesterase type B
LEIYTFENFDFSPVQMFPSTGLFHRSISQSGTATCPWAVKTKGRKKAIAEQVAGLFDCPVQSSEDLISCLRKQDAYKVYGADHAIEVSWQKNDKNLMKLKSDKKINYHIKHRIAGSTN